MLDWLANHWYVVWGSLCGLLILVGHLTFRKSPGTRPARMFYAVFSNLDPLPDAVASRIEQLFRSTLLIAAGCLVIGIFLFLIWLVSKIDVVP